MECLYLLAISSEIECQSEFVPLKNSPEITLLFSGNSDDQVRLKFLSIGEGSPCADPGSLIIIEFVIG